MRRPSALALPGLVVPGLGHLVPWSISQALNAVARIAPTAGARPHLFYRRHREPDDLGVGLALLLNLVPTAVALGLALRPGHAWPVRFLDALFGDSGGLQRLLTWGLAWLGVQAPHLSSPVRDLDLLTLAALAWGVTVVVTAWVVAYRRAYPSFVRAAREPALRREIARAFLRHPQGMAGLIGSTTLVTVVLLAPFLALHPPTTSLGGAQLVPGWHLTATGDTLFLMGTDGVGRDLFSRLLFGGRVSLLIGLSTVALATTVGTAVGLVAGYVGGLVDTALMGLVDALLSLPRLVLLLAILGILRAGAMSGTAKGALMVAVLAATGWMVVARLVRAEVLSLRERDWVAAAQALGLPTWRILFRHVLPNAMSPVIVFASLALGTTILVEAGLSFLGLGISEPTPTWGKLVDDGRGAFQSAPWLSTFPGLVIVWAVMSFNLVGDGLRDALDPTRRGL